MKKYFAVLASMFLMTVAVAQTSLPTMIKKPDLSRLYMYGHCYDIDMAYFNDCQASKVVIQSVLEVDEQGRVTDVSVTSTGNRGLDAQIRSALRRAEFSPLVYEGVPTKVNVLQSITVRIPAGDKEPIKRKTAKLLRQICANDDKCDQNQLEGELAKRNL